MKSIITTVGDYLNKKEGEAFIVDSLRLPLLFSDSGLKSLINIFLKELREDLTLVIESDYVDKVFRDSYYKYYSTKLMDFKRNCVRLSFFDPTCFNDSTPWDDKMGQNMINGYLGFAVLRPIRKCIGRNVINPIALKTGLGERKICSTTVASSCLGIKLTAHGFPHSSQDGEIASCAETTVWSIMNYFGNKYPEYRPVFPSDIIESLSTTSYERQIPSEGLNFQQIALALRKEGFGSKVYRHTISNFKELLCCYIESGIPVALAIKTNKFYHATVCIGLKKIDRSKVLLNERIIDKKTGKKIFVWNNSLDEFIVNDDNKPPYRFTSFGNPTSYYPPNKDGSKTGWEGGFISYFIAPLHRKVYLLPEVAIASSDFWVNYIVNNKEQHVVRTFLTSNRSYKEYLMERAGLNQSQKEILLSIDLPKFLWVTETASRKDFDNYKVENLLLIDATCDHHLRDYASWLFWKVGENSYVYDKTYKTFEKISVTLPLLLKSFDTNLSLY